METWNIYPSTASWFHIHKKDIYESKKIRKKKTTTSRWYRDQTDQIIEIRDTEKNEVWLEKQKPTDIPEQQVYDCHMWLKFKDY